jgi:hypothetical protein
MVMRVRRSIKRKKKMLIFISVIKRVCHQIMLLVSLLSRMKKRKKYKKKNKCMVKKKKKVLNCMEMFNMLIMNKMGLINLER